MTHNKITIVALTASCLFVLILTCFKKHGIISAPSSPSVPERRRFLDADKELEAIKQKLKPRPLERDDDGNLKPHQFLHLHHMKTGGTSLDHMLKCAMERLAQAWEIEVPYYNIHECSRGKFKKCLENSTNPCRQSMDESAIMSYCAALSHLDTFGWKEDSVAAMTILRHPVDRVWSMFRFEPRTCYSCKNLTDIYEIIDNDSTDGYDSLCLGQLQNHETTNLLTTDWPEDASEEDRLNEAIENMKSFFTVIGLTEELPATRQLLGSVFPWLDVTYEGSKKMCNLPHSNSSPKNNHCVRKDLPDGKFTTVHWDLPDHPDEATRKAIEAHNQMDLKLYEAAVQYFELQKQAMGMGEEG